MPDNETSKFDIRIDEASPESQFQEDVDELQVVNLNKRITRMSVLITCLFGAIILLGYLDLKKNLFKMDNSGTMEIQSLTKGVDSRFSSLSLQQAKFEEALSKKIAPLEKAVASIQPNLKEVSTAIKYIRAARKEDNKKLANSIEAINQTLATVPTKLQNLTSDIDKINNKHTNELSNLSRATKDIKNNLQNIQADIASLSSSKLDKKTLDIELTNQQKIFQQTLIQLTSDIEKRISSIEKKIKEMEKAKMVSERHRQIEPKKSSPSMQQEPQTIKKAVIPKPGTIIEQDIQ
jgi:chromosome segregation ATPase